MRYTTPLAPRQHDRDVHDLGFIFMSTYYRWYRLTQDPKLKDALIQARPNHCDSRERAVFALVCRRGFALHRHHDERRHHLLCGARNGRPQTADCATPLSHHPPQSATALQEGIFELRTGEFLRQSTQQGYRGDSCWSRGLAWALYGFSLSCRPQPRSAFSGNRRSLRRLLHHALQQRWRSAVDF